MLFLSQLKFYKNRGISDLVCAGGFSCTMAWAVGSGGPSGTVQGLFRDSSGTLWVLFGGSSGGLTLWSSRKCDLKKVVEV